MQHAWQLHVVGIDRLPGHFFLGVFAVVSLANPLVL